MRNNLKQLVTYSYTNGQLDQATVETIADHLDRKTLKEFLKLLKQEEAKNDVLLISAKPLSDEEKGKLAKLFEAKNLLYTVDPKMISGVKVIENNQEYEINLNRTFHDIMVFLTSND